MHRILVVRLGAMGDILHALPAVASLKHNFPTSELTWLVEPRWAALLAGNPFVDRVALFRRGSPRAVLQSCGELAGGGYDMAVDFQGLVKSAVLASLARPARIFGFHQSLVREKAAALFYSDRVETGVAHVVDRNLALAQAAGASSLVRAFPVPPGKSENPLPAGGFVLASPLAGWPAKQWPLEYYSRLAERLAREIGVPLVLDVPRDALPEIAAVPHVLAGSTSLEGLIFATRHALAVVGVDSGPLHLAAALGRPGVAIFGPTDPSRNGPYCGEITVLRDPGAATSYKRRAVTDPSMCAVTPDAVFEALRVRLPARAGSPGCAV